MNVLTLVYCNNNEINFWHHKQRARIVCHIHWLIEQIIKGTSSAWIGSINRKVQSQMIVKLFFIIINGSVHICAPVIFPRSFNICRLEMIPIWNLMCTSVNEIASLYICKCQCCVIWNVVFRFCAWVCGHCTHCDIYCKCSSSRLRMVPRLNGKSPDNQTDWYDGWIE